MALKKKTVKPKKVAPKKSKKRTPAIIPVGTKGMLLTPNNVKSPSIDEIKEILTAPSLTHQPYVKTEPTTDQLVRELKMRVTALEHELENKLPTDYGYNYPIDVTVMNVSEKTLENVPLFNDKYKDQQDVVYSSLFPDGYYNVLKFKNAIGVGSEDKQIGMIRVMSNSQMLSSALVATSNSMDGIQTSLTLFMVIDPYQNQSCILQRNQKLSYNVGTNLIIKSLPPMTRFTYTIYFISEDYQKRMEELKKKINPQP